MEGRTRERERWFERENTRGGNKRKKIIRNKKSRRKKKKRRRIEVRRYWTSILVKKRWGDIKGNKEKKGGETGCRVQPERLAAFSIGKTRSGSSRPERSS